MMYQRHGLAACHSRISNDCFDVLHVRVVPRVLYVVCMMILSGFSIVVVGAFLPTIVE